MDVGETDDVCVLFARVDPVLEEGDAAFLRLGAPLSSGRFLAPGMESSDDDRLCTV